MLPAVPWLTPSFTWSDRVGQGPGPGGADWAGVAAGAGDAGAGALLAEGAGGALPLAVVLDVLPHPVARTAVQVSAAAGSARRTRSRVDCITIPSDWVGSASRVTVKTPAPAARLYLPGAGQWVRDCGRAGTVRRDGSHGARWIAGATRRVDAQRRGHRRARPGPARPARPLPGRPADQPDHPVLRGPARPDHHLPPRDLRDLPHRGRGRRPGAPHRRPRGRAPLRHRRRTAPRTRLVTGTGAQPSRWTMPGAKAGRQIATYSAPSSPGVL